MVGRLVGGGSVFESQPVFFYFFFSLDLVSVKI